MVARDHGEVHRQASWLELLFDLAFVVAVAQAGMELEHAFAEAHPGSGLLGYFVVFGAIWWAWMAFTWFANVFDTDDVPYRVLIIVMIGGSLGLAAGVPQIFALDFRVGVISYIVMRLAYVGQWLRVLRTRDGTWRPVAWKLIVLTTVNQAGWVAFLWVPEEWKLIFLVVWFAADLATPYLAGWDARMGGHVHHIVERYGLFTIIVLGESIAAATTALSQAISNRAAFVPLFILGLGGLVTVCSLWWIYFDFSTGHAPARSRVSQYVWGYMHFFVFAALAAVGAGLALAAASLADPAHVALPDWAVAMLPAGAVAVFLATVALIESLAEGSHERKFVIAKLMVALLSAAAAMAAPAVSVHGSILALGLMLAGLVAYGVVVQQRLYAQT
jgi:low temperature requirement protein LtrA